MLNAVDYPGCLRDIWPPSAYPCSKTSPHSLQVKFTPLSNPPLFSYWPTIPLKSSSSKEASGVAALFFNMLFFGFSYFSYVPSDILDVVPSFSEPFLSSDILLIESDAEGGAELSPYLLRT